MISFKEYLLLNEEKDPQINAIKKICKNDFDIILKAGGTGSGSENNIMKKINAEIEDTSEQFKNFDELKEKTKKIISKEKTKNANTKDIEESDTKVEDFYRIIYNNRNIIEQISPHNVSKIRAIFQKVDRNNDKKIDKEEFKNAIKEIQKSVDKNNAAMITYLMYILNVGGSHFAVGQTTGALSQDSNIKPEKIFTDENDKEIKNYFTDEKIKFLNSLFIELKGFTFEKSILKNFKTYKDAKHIFSGKTELGDEGFTPKTQEQKEKEELEDEYVKNKEEMNKTQAEIDRLNKEAKEILDSNKSNIDDLGNPTKEKWFGLDVDLPEPGNDKELEDFISSVKNVVKEKFKKIVDEVKSYQIKKKKNDLEEDVVLKVIKQKGFKILKEEGVIGLDSGDEEIDEQLNSINNKIEKIILKYERKLTKINNKIESSDNYNKQLSLKTDFKFALIDFGKDINNSFIDLQENIRRKVRNLRNKSWDAELRSHKPLRQQEEDNFNVKKIINLLTSATSKDHLIIAKIMLINILRNINESKKVVELLNAPNFESLKNYIYSGNTNSVYAMDSNSVEAKDGMYIFNSGKAKVYKNPRDLLNAAGINVDELTVDVMKGLKKELKAQAEKGANLADEYKKAEQELLGIIQKIVQPNASVVSEDIKTLIGKGKDFLLDKARKKQTPEQATEQTPDQATEQVTKQNPEQAVEQKPEQQTQPTQTNQLENYVKEIGLPDDYDPKGTTVKSVILRQTFKGYILLKKDNKWYVGNYKDLDNIKKALQPQQSSVVTSGAADSTYGDGYNYSKKADAIKKKLNCTTYTYSPNSKMKIVRRTFD